MNLCKKILDMLRLALANKQKLKILQEKLDSSQEAYKTLLEQYETFANLNIELSTKIEQLEASATTINAQSMMRNLKRKMKN